MDNQKILIIDDDAMTCSLLETIFKMEDYQPVSVTKIDSQGIIPLLHQHNPDIIILDFHLGAKETLEYMVAIRKDTTWQRLPVLMASAINRRKECLAAGANDFILKPFNWDEITKTAKNLRDNLAYQEA